MLLLSVLPPPRASLRIAVCRPRCSGAPGPHGPPSQESGSPGSTPLRPGREEGSLEPWLTLADLQAVARSSLGKENSS